MSGGSISSFLNDAPVPGTGSRTMPKGSGADGRRIVLRGGTVISMDPAVGDFAEGDVLIEGKKIAAVGANLQTGDAEVVDAKGMIVTPGFVDTHHHLFETALRGFLADALLINDGMPHGKYNYMEWMLGKFAKNYTPDDVYISEVVGSLSQLDAGVTTVLDISQIHHSPEHSDAGVQALKETGRRACFGYFEGDPESGTYVYPGDARRLKAQHFSSDDQLVTMVFGGEIYLPGAGEGATWEIGRELGVPIAAHIVGTFGMAPLFDSLAPKFGPDLIFIHMTGMTDFGWQAVKDSGAHVSIAVPIEMQMRHGDPPLQKALSLGIQPSLSSDVECTMTADFFTQMRSAMTLQRSLINQAALNGATDLPELLTSADVLRFATLEGAKGLHLDKKVGSLTPGKEADLLLLDATALNVTPLNHAPGAVVTLMERSNVDSVMVAGKFRKWNGKMLDMHLPTLRARLETSRDGLFERAGVPQDLFRK
ncbi:MAG: amidohydrolase [Caulobacterales bacterium 32-69-10]|nr:MAG: amidohydrolase [Caulobacterales bacterium 32-69-10]